MNIPLTNKLFVAAIVLLLTTCNVDSRQAANVINQVAAVVELHPDSALRLLEAIPKPEALSTPQYMEYVLRQVQAKDKADQNIADDTTIFVVADYYLQQKNTDKAALALFYCGRVCHMQKKHDKAMQYYLRADTQAQNTNDINLRGLIAYYLGYINYDKLVLNEAITYFKQSFQHFRKKGAKYQNEIWSLLSIGNSFTLNRQLDSATFYYNMGLELAWQYRDTLLCSTLNQCIAQVFAMRENHIQANEYLRKAEALGVRKDNFANLYCSRAVAFYNLEKYDSTLYYAGKVIQLSKTDSVTSSELSVAYEFMSSVEELKHNYKKALDYYQQHCKYVVAVFTEKMERSVLEIQKKYQMEQLENERNQLKIGRQRFINISLGLVMVLGGVGFGFYLYRVRKREELVEAEKSLFRMAASYNEKERTLRNALLAKFDILKKSTLVESQLREDERSEGQKVLKKFRQIVYGDGDAWAMLYKTMNEVHDGICDRIKQKYPELNEVEFRVACLAYADFSSGEIAAIIGLSVNTINAKRVILRRKMGIAEYGNLKETILRTVG